MTPTPNHSRAAAHYTGLLDHLHGEQIMEALRELERAQVDANKASVVCQSRDYELAHFALRTAQITLWRVLGNAGFDAAVIREGFNA